MWDPTPLNWSRLCGIGLAKTGVRYVGRNSEWTDNAWTTYLNYHTGFVFNEPWEIVTGEWTIQLLFKGHKLAEKSFSVFSDTHNKSRGSDATK